MSDFESRLQAQKAYIDGILLESLEQFQGVPAALLASMSYSLLGGGKRIRPILFLESYRLFGGKVQSSIRLFAAAIEYMHIYTLVHDDLPALDNDAVRRGQPANHIQFGESIALLAGDALLNGSYELLSLAMQQADPDERERFLRAFGLFAKSSGGKGVIGGQALEFMHKDDASRLAAQIETIYLHKTCDLMALALGCGAILAGANEEQTALMEEFAYLFGFVFQIQDDLLDIQEKGLLDKVSLPALKGIDIANTMVEDRTKAAQDILRKLGKDTAFLTDLLEFAARRKQ